LPTSRHPFGVRKPPDRGFVVFDACALDDLLHSGLSRDVLGLPYDFAVADVVWASRENSFPAEERARLHAVEAPGECYGAACEFCRRFPGLGAEDAYSIVIGRVQWIKAYVFSGPATRAAATAEGFRPKELAWLVEQVLRARALEIPRAKLCLARCRSHRFLIGVADLLDDYLAPAPSPRLQRL
jgi:hypothetical protein